MNIAQWESALSAGELDRELTALYAAEPAEPRERYLRLLERCAERFGPGETELLSAPGRTELAGNHTDHQHGRVLCAAVTLDTLAAAAPAAEGRVTLLSEGFGEISLSLDSLEPRREEAGTTAALVRGVAAALARQGFSVGGFQAAVSSQVGAGSGLSSSAALEVLVGAVFSALYNNWSLKPLTLARAGQEAERLYFGKPSGLMDQAASAFGGVTMLDLADPAAPTAELLQPEIERLGWVLCAVDSRGSHAALTEEYAAIPEEMCAVARALGAEVLRDVPPQALEDPARRAALEAALPLRAIWRAEHFFAENRRVPAMKAALEQGDMERYRVLMNESGRSSRALLQNVIPAGGSRDGTLALALDRAEALLAGRGAWRVHGGGFAGCIQCLLPKEDFAAFRRSMDDLYGRGACFPLRFRPRGAYRLGRREEQNA